MGRVFAFTLRRAALAVLRRIDRDITIRHHYTRDPITIHAFKHKGYWWHGKKREQTSMALFAVLARPGDAVIEIGGHVGYISVYLARLVGPGGQLTVFEPGPNNIPYIRKNLARIANATIVESALSDNTGTADFYIEDLSGQDNTLLETYEIFDANVKAAGIEGIQRTRVVVPVTTLDTFLDTHPIRSPRFIKIDVEGAELRVLRGMERTLRSPGLSLMVEITKDHADVLAILRGAGFRIFTSERREINAGDAAPTNNYFCIRTESDIQRVLVAS
jgi:FkbM family methyltransferase